jgi:hypothetical protein
MLQTMSSAKKVRRPKRRKRKAVHTLGLEPFLELWGNWEVTKSDGEDPLFSLKNHHAQSETTRNSPRAFEAMKGFFSIKTPNDALEFFKKYGPLQLESGLGGKKNRGVAVPVRFSTVIARRDSWLNASRRGRNARQYQAKDMQAFVDDVNLMLPLHAELLFDNPVLAVRCLDVEEALKAAVHIDRLNGLAWGLCAWKKCGKAFSIGSHPEKKFCSPECAGRQSSKTWWDKPENKQHSNDRRKKGLNEHL